MRSPTINEQLTRSPAINEQLTRSPAINEQLMRSPTINEQLMRSPTINEQLTRSPTINEQSIQPRTINSMKYDPDKHHRRSIRLPGYDYSQPGAYFVTICAYQRQCIFGKIIDGQMRLNQYGAIVADEWQKSSVIRKEIGLDAWMVMPNHFHGIVIIQNSVRANGNDDVGANGRSPLPGNAPVQMKPKSLSSLMAGFKSITTKKINMLRDAPATALWQRNYYEHIIRNPDAMNKIRQYIINNPVSWEIDQLHPDNPSKW